MRFNGTPVYGWRFEELRITLRGHEHFGWLMQTLDAYRKAGMTPRQAAEAVVRDNDEMQAEALK